MWVIKQMKWSATQPHPLRFVTLCNMRPGLVITSITLSHSVKEALGYACSAGRFRFRLRFRELAPVGCAIQTVWVRRFTRMISSFLFRLSESESEPESACTVNVPLGMSLKYNIMRDALSFWSKDLAARNSKLSSYPKKLIASLTKNSLLKHFWLERNEVSERCGGRVYLIESGNKRFTRTLLT